MKTVASHASKRVVHIKQSVHAASVILLCAGFALPVYANTLNQIQTKTKTQNKTQPVFNSAHSPKKSNQNTPIITVKPGPPPGFGAAVLNQKQTTYISAYYGGQFIGNYLATFTLKSIKLHAPELLLKALPQLKSKSKVLSALSNSLETHSQNLCVKSGTEKLCKALNPKVLGVVFNSSNYRLDVFVNPKLQKAQLQSVGKLQPSTAGLSLSNQTNTAFDFGNGTRQLNFSTTSVLGYKNNRIFFQGGLAYTHTNLNQNSSITSNTLADQTTLNIGQLYYARVQGGHLFQAGIMSTIGSEMLASEQILGVAAQNSYEGFNSQSNFLNQNNGTPVYVNLTLPSQIQVYSNGALIYATNLKAGRHQLDTRTFPLGSYNITIKITNNLGQVSTQNLFFVKQAGLFGHKSLYYMMLGFQGANNTLYGGSTNPTPKSFEFNLPEFNQQPLLNFFNEKMLGKYASLEFDFLSNFKAAYGTATINWYATPELTLSPTFLMSNEGFYGAQVNASLQTHSGWSLYLNAVKMHSSKSQAQEEALLTDPSSFFPITPTNYQINSNLSWSFQPSDTSVSLGYSIGKQLNQGPLQRSYSAGLTQQILHSSYLSSSVALTFTRTLTDSLLEASINVLTSTADQLFISGNYGYTRSQYFGPDSGPITRSSTGSVSITKNIRLSNNRTAQIEAGYSQQGDVKNYSAQASYQSQRLSANINYTRSDAPGYSQSNWAGNISTSIVYAGHHWSVGYSGNWFTGVMVKLNSPIPVKANVFVNGRQVGTVSSNFAQPFFLMPFKTYRVSIVPVGNQLVSYSAYPKTVTLYQGNVQQLTWQLGRQYLLFAQIVNSKKQPLKNWLLSSKNAFDTTNGEGFLQASLTSKDKVLTFRSIKGLACTVTLPSHLNIKQQVAVIKTPLVCTSKPINSKKTKK